MNKVFILLLIVSTSVWMPVKGLCAVPLVDSDAEELLEQMAAASDAESDDLWRVLGEELSDLRQHPINLNTATREQLRRLPFLSDEQIAKILLYVYAVQGMQTIYELQLVDAMDRQTIDLLLPFVCVGPKASEAAPLLKTRFVRGRHELSTRVGVPLRAPADADAWQGSAVSHSLRYRFDTSGKFGLGLMADQDAGEPFFGRANRQGYDFYSFHFQLNDCGPLRTLLVGDYRAGFGLGLAVNQTFGLGKTSSLATIGNGAGGIRPHASTAESGFLRGLAGTFAWQRFSLSAFYSFQRQDAHVENEFITSLKTDGIHRTASDFEKRRKADVQVVVTHLRYCTTTFECGLTGVYQVFNRLLTTSPSPYRWHYPQGRHFFVGSADYRWRIRRWQLCGEVAASRGGGVASLHVLRFSPAEGWRLVLAHRYYAKNYVAWLSHSLSEGGQVRNETGCYAGVEASPFRRLRLTASVDFFRFPWLRYGVDRPSEGFEALCQATYSVRRNLRLLLRYQYKEKGRNCAVHSGEVHQAVRHKVRCQLAYELPDAWTVRTTVDAVFCRSPHASWSRGGMLTQQLSYRFQHRPFQLAVHISLFDTTDYDSRLTTYERGLLYTYSFASYYGKGLRASLFINSHINRHLTAILRLGQTVYKETPALPDRPRQSAVDAQLVWKF